MLTWLIGSKGLCADSWGKLADRAAMVQQNEAEAARQELGEIVEECAALFEKRFSLGDRPPQTIRRLARSPNTKPDS